MTPKSLAGAEVTQQDIARICLRRGDVDEAEGDAWCVP